MLLPFVVTNDQSGREHLTTGVTELSFKSIRISPLSLTQQIRDPSLYVIPHTVVLMLIRLVVDLLQRSIIIL
jgi:hypothetical protein